MKAILQNTLGVTQPKDLGPTSGYQRPISSLNTLQSDPKILMAI